MNNKTQEEISKWCFIEPYYPFSYKSEEKINYTVKNNTLQPIGSITWLWFEREYVFVPICSPAVGMYYIDQKNMDCILIFIKDLNSK